MTLAASASILTQCSLWAYLAHRLWPRWEVAVLVFMLFTLLYEIWLTLKQILKARGV